MKIKQDKIRIETRQIRIETQKMEIHSGGRRKTRRLLLAMEQLQDLTRLVTRLWYTERQVIAVDLLSQTHM